MRKETTMKVGKLTVSVLLRAKKRYYNLHYLQSMFGSFFLLGGEAEYEEVSAAEGTNPIAASRTKVRQ